tara:strand:- start:5940 stop:6287 length:348 start_codon:yes stop_codon:yes gene_type:complete
MTRTARGKEIDMASLIASSDPGTTVVGNVNANLAGDVQSTSTSAPVPAQEIQQAYYENKLNQPKDNIKTSEDLQEKITGKSASTQVIDTRTFTREGKKYQEIEYADGSIEEKEVK